jgi:carbamoyl-phosphate synthase small subunit
MKAKLILITGEIFEGESFGYEGNINGEIVFNTGMMWYPETLTDPSYSGQILVSTFPLIGNYWIPDIEEKDEYGIQKYFESEKVHISWLIVSEYSNNYNHFQAKTSLWEFLKYQKIPAITWIDTRALTHLIRERGCILWKIIIERNADTLGFEDPNTRLLAYEVGTKTIQTYGNGKKRVCIVDMGIKNNMLRNFLKHDITIIRVPGDSAFMDGNLDFDALFISNGPWDPSLYTTTIEQIKKAIGEKIPCFWICLWNQLLALASGASTYKLPYWHRGQNQPVKDLETGKCILTSQNHSYAINESTLPNNTKVWMKNINDGTNEGIIFEDAPIRSVQFHPESSPGPNDSQYLFENFIKSIN